MRNLVRFVGVCLFCLLGTVSLTSCSEDEEIIVENLKIPTTNFLYDEFWPFVANGEVLQVGGISIDESSSSPGLRIEKVDYFFDDTLIASSNAAPFAMNYLVKGQSIGKHKLTIKISVKGGEGYLDMTRTLNLDVTVLEEPFVLDFDVAFDNAAHDNGEIRNGETFAGSVAISDATSIDASITKVEYYWDGSMFGATSIPPYRFSFPIDNQSLGEHEFMFVVTTSSSLGTLTSRNRMRINLVD